jgi:hypothetical protein
MVSGPSARTAVLPALTLQPDPSSLGCGAVVVPVAVVEEVTDPLPVAVE